MLPEILGDHGATKDIAKLSDTDGRWSLLLGINAEYEITVKSSDDERRELAKIRLAVGVDPIDGVAILVAPPM